MGTGSLNVNNLSMDQTWGALRTWSHDPTVSEDTKVDISFTVGIGAKSQYAAAERALNLSNAGAKAVNEVARQTFLNMVKDLCGIARDQPLSALPENVQKAMKLKSGWLWQRSDWDVGKGRPLTARRIKAVIDAVDQYRGAGDLKPENYNVANSKYGANSPFGSLVTSMQNVTVTRTVGDDVNKALANLETPLKELNSYIEGKYKGDIPDVTRTFKNYVNKLCEKVAKNYPTLQSRITLAGVSLRSMLDSFVQAIRTDNLSEAKKKICGALEDANKVVGWISSESSEIKALGKEKAAQFRADMILQLREMFDKFVGEPAIAKKLDFLQRFGDIYVAVDKLNDLAARFVDTINKAPNKDPNKTWPPYEKLTQAELEYTWDNKPKYDDLKEKLSKNLSDCIYIKDQLVKEMEGILTPEKNGPKEGADKGKIDTQTFLNLSTIFLEVKSIELPTEDNFKTEWANCPEDMPSKFVNPFSFTGIEQGWKMK